MSHDEDAIAARAGRLCRRYAALHREHRHGAIYLGRPALDYATAQQLCRTWDDDAHLEAMMVAWLTDETPGDVFLRGTRTLQKFRSRASGYDEQVRRGGAPSDVSDRERAAARRWRQRVGWPLSECRHDPPDCASQDACLDRTAMELRR